jgi:hypothetical protein
MREFFPNSPKTTATKSKFNFPWQTVPFGKSFIVHHHEIKFSTLRSQASYYGKRLGKKFKVVDHGESVGYEVACIGTRDKAKKEEPVKVSHWVDTKPE